MVLLFQQNFQEHKLVRQELTKVYGINKFLAHQICDSLGFALTLKVQDLTEAAVYKLRKHVEQIDDGSEDDEDIGDDFESLYKGEISKSGAPILPSKRARKTPEKIQVSQEDLAEVQNSTETSSADPIETAEEGDASIEEMQEEEIQSNEEDTNSED